MALPLRALYHGTTFAVEVVFEWLPNEFNALGIRVKLIQPSGIKTYFSGVRLSSATTDTSWSIRLLKKVFDVLGPMTANGSAPERIAEDIYSAPPTGSISATTPVRTRCNCSPAGAPMPEQKHNADSLIECAQR